MLRRRSRVDPVEQLETLLDRYENQGHHGRDLSDAANHLQSMPQGRIVDLRRSEAVARLGWLMLDVSVRLRDIRVIDWAVELMRREQSMLDKMLDPAGDIRIAGALGALLSQRFYVGHNYEDASAALDVLRQREDVLRQVPSVVDETTSCLFWWTLGRATLDLADVTRRLEHHRAAVEYHERALRLAVRGSVMETQIEVGRCQATSGLADRMALSGDHSLVTSARDTNIATMTRATARTDVGDSLRCPWLQNLAHLLLDRYSSAKEPDPADLVAAESAVERALALVDGDGPNVVSLRGMRADVLLARDPFAQVTVNACVDALMTAARHRSPVALRMGANAVSLLSRDQHWQRAAEAGELALSVLAHLLERHVAEEYQRIFLREGDTLAVATAYAWHRCGEPGHAVRVAEDNRATLWRNRYLEPRDLIRRLRENGEVELAAEYTEKLRIVRDTTVRDETLRNAQDAIDAMTPRLEPLRSALRSAGRGAAKTGGGSVHVLAAPQGGVALVVDAQGATSSVDLPELSADEAARLAAVFRRRVVDASNPPNLRIRTVAATIERLDRVLRRPLEDSGAGPDRGVMVPIGHLTGLPVHARPGGPADAFPSTVPSLSMTSGARGHERRTMLRVLVVPDLSEEGQVPGVQAEVEAILRAFPHARVLSHGTSADEVIRLLGEHDVVHFACHGVNDDDSPLDSRLLVRPGESIRLADFLLADLDGAPLVVLSACQTAVHGTDLPDESQSLASGLLAVGASSVVASLWPVPGIATAALMAEFYALLAGGEGPATALVRAQWRLAEGTVVDPRHEQDWRNAYYWGGFVHLGGLT